MPVNKSNGYNVLTIFQTDGQFVTQLLEGITFLLSMGE
jgi:hypothetical protein